MELGLSRREFLERAKTGLKLILLPPIFTGLASLVFGDEDYLAKLPPLNERKVTEELIQEILNVGSVKGILEKYGNEENIFYVEFTPDGRNNLDELVRNEPEKWDGSYVLISENNFLVTKDTSSSLKEAISILFLSHKKKRIKFIFYNLQGDKGLELKTKYIVNNNHSLHYAFKMFFEANNSNDANMPARLLYTSSGKMLDGGQGGAKRNKDIWAGFNNDAIWIEHWLYGKWQTNDAGEKVIIRYNFTGKIKEVKR